MRPYSSNATLYILATSSSEVTLAFTKIAPSSFATLLPISSFRSTMTTFAPSSTNRCAVAYPIPLAPPVITATRSCNRFIYSPSYS